MFDSSDNSVVSPTVLKLREELSAITCSTAAEFFAGVREIARNYDQRFAVIETELAIVQQTLPEKLKELKEAKEELLDLKNQIVTLRDGYVSEAKTILESLKKNVPFAVEKMESIAQKKEQLRKLECLEQGNLLLSQCEKAVELKNLSDTQKFFAALLDQYKLVMEFGGESLTETFEESFHSICSEVKNYADNGITSVLTKLGFPFDDSLDYNVMKSDISTLISYIVLLYQSYDCKAEGSGIEAIYSAIFDPIRKRFLYFFYGDRKTNDISKPQWYFSLVLSWFQTSLPFFELVISGVAEYLRINLEPAIYFHRSLSDLIIEKTESLLDNEDILQKTFLFSHLVDECISYEEHKSQIDLCQFGKSVLDLLCRHDILLIWLTIEKDCCITKIDDMLANPNRWQNRYALLEDADQYCVCECAEAFVSLIQGLQQRSRLLTDENAQRQFVDLQLILVDDFRQRLVQIASQAESPWTEPYPQVMNAIWYLHDVVEEWNETFVLAGIHPLGNRKPVFQISKQFYEHVWAQMADDVVTSLNVQCKGLITDYQQQRWSSMDSKALSVERDISAAFCPLLMKIRTSFSNVGNHYSRVSVAKLFMKMTSVVGQLLLDVVQGTSYNAEGGAQMLHDIEKGLLPALNFIFSRCGVTNFRAEHDKHFIQLIGSLSPQTS